MRRREFLRGTLSLGAAGLLPNIGLSASGLLGNAAPIAESVLPTTAALRQSSGAAFDVLCQKEVEKFFEYIKEKSLDPKMFTVVEADKLLEEVRFVEPIWRAAVNDEWDAVKQYLEREPHLMNVTGNNVGWSDLTLFQLAAGWCPDVDVLKLLVSLGVDVKAEYTNGETPLHMAARHNSSADVLKYLVSHYADVNTEVDTLLHIAAKKNSRDVLTYLVSLGADVNARTRYGETLLFHAVENRNDPAAKYLISQGADVNAKDDFGRTMLHKLFVGIFSCDGAEKIRYLFSLGIDVQARDNAGKTALDYASAEEDRQILREWMSKIAL